MFNNIAVIGGSGFIGGNTVRELINRGFNVTVLDIVQPWVSGVRYRYCDIRNNDSVDAELSCNGYDAVYCLAGIIFAKDCSGDPTNAFNTNILGLKNVLDACVKYKVSRFLFSSTVHTYENCDPAYSIVDETTPISTEICTNLYITSKIIGEQLVRSYHAEFGLPYTIFRYGVAYGVGGHKNNVIHTFLNNITNGIPIKIYGDGSDVRNYLYVNDHAHGNVLGLSDRCKNEVVNLDSDETISIISLVNLIKEITNKDPVIEYANARKNDYNGRVVNCDKASRILNWKPEITLRGGIEMMYSSI